MLLTIFFTNYFFTTKCFFKKVLKWPETDEKFFFEHFFRSGNFHRGKNRSWKKVTGHVTCVNLCKESLSLKFPGFLRVPSGVLPWSFRDPSGIFPGSFRDPSGILPRSFRDPFGILPGSFRDLSGILPGSFSDPSGILPGSFRDFSGILPGFLRDPSGISPGSAPGSVQFPENVFMFIVELCT